MSPIDLTQQKESTIDLILKNSDGISLCSRVKSINIKTNESNLIHADKFSLGTEYIETFNSNIPIIYIQTENNSQINSKDYYLNNTTVFVTNSEYRQLFTEAKIKGRGNSSWNDMPKKSYAIKLKDKDKFLGMKKHKNFALVSNYADKTLLRNEISYKMGKDIMNHLEWSPSTEQIHLYVNGQYLGIYLLCETVKIGENRVNIPNIKDCKSESEIRYYGFIVEANERCDADFNFETTRKSHYSLKEPDAEEISQEYKNHIVSVVQTAEDALFSTDFADVKSKNYYGAYLDIKSLIDWYLVNEITKNVDATFFSSCFMYYYPETQKIHLGPIWDFDIALGNINYQGCDNPEGWWVRNSMWFYRLFQDPYFEQKVKDRWKEIKSSIDVWSESIQDNADIIGIDAEYNFKRWSILGKYVWPNADGYENRTTYQSEIDYLKNWIENRISWIDSELSQ